MFTKEILMDLFTKNAKRNFRIYTNIAEGRGINGIIYKTFTGCNYDDDRKKCLESYIKGFGKDYLVIECEKTKGCWYDNAKREVYVPYDNIVMVDFINDEGHPLQFEGEHNLEEV